jgi:Uma2 family endonuclease
MLSTVSTGNLTSDLPRRRFTADEVMRMAEEGILGEDEHVELLDGELVVMSPQGPPHAAWVMELTRILGDAYKGLGHVRAQVPFDAGRHSLPEPDLAVVRGAPLDYRARHPTGRDAFLIIEVARTSQQIDRRKVGIYAAAQAPVYWLIDLPKRHIEIFSQPKAEDYLERRTVVAGQEIELPGLDICKSVGDLVD